MKTYNISYKTFTDAKPVRIRFDKVHKYIKVYDGTRYLTFFGLVKYCAIFKKIRYLTGVENGIAYVISHNYEKIKFDSYNSLRFFAFGKNVDIS